MIKFIRPDNYNGKAMEAVRKIRKKCEELNKPTLVIPGTDSLIFYYRGNRFLDITRRGIWNRFADDYDKYFEEHGEIGKHILKCLEERPEEIEQIYEDNLDIILDCIAKGLPKDKERASQQVIALNNIRENISPMDNSYFVCGLEATIPKSYFGKTPEIDLIAVNIEEKEILLIEYKCQHDALFSSINGIDKHCEDYLTILENEDLRNDLKTGMRNAYRLMRKIYMDDKNEESESELEFKEFEIKIAFLITKRPCKEKDNGEGNIAPDDLETAKDKLDGCIQDELKKHIKCLICDKPEDCSLEGWKNFDKWDEMVKES